MTVDLRRLRASLRRHAPWLGAVLALAVVALVLATSTDALARPGGGSSYSGGSRSSGSSSGGSSSGGGGGGDGAGALIQILVWLCLEHPAVGIPLTLIVVGVFVAKKVFAGKQEDWSSGGQAPPGGWHAAQHAPAMAPDRWAGAAGPSRDHDHDHHGSGAGLEAIQAVDPGFSRVVFEDFFYSLYAEVHRARGAAPPPPMPGHPPVSALDLLSAYVAPAAAQALVRATQGPVGTVIVGALRAVDVDAGPRGSRVVMEVEANYTEAGRGFYVRELWTLTRGPGARSRTPDKVRVLGCPGCGAPQAALFGGQCRHCRRTVNDGSFDWVVQSIDVRAREQRPPMLGGHVEERGTNLPTIVDDELDAALAALRAKDPAFDPGAFQQRVGTIFAQFQQAWSSRNLAQMRPFLSDALFSTQEYWVQAYVAQRLRNVTERARITNLQVVKAATDAHYDALTVRFWATGLDYTLSDDGRLVSGSRSQERPYSEYWTLIRGAGRKGPTRTDLACSNCGAPLQVNMAGQCQYCQVKVTTGEFDWVLSRIEQDESYEG